MASPWATLRFTCIGATVRTARWTFPSASQASSMARLPEASDGEAKEFHGTFDAGLSRRRPGSRDPGRDRGTDRPGRDRNSDKGPHDGYLCPKAHPPSRYEEETDT